MSIDSQSMMLEVVAISASVISTPSKFATGSTFSCNLGGLQTFCGLGYGRHVPIGNNCCKVCGHRSIELGLNEHLDEAVVFAIGLFIRGVVIRAA